jgi:hypothetical protein
MPVKGVNPGYFAGMPTVHRDPRAGQVDPSYAAMPGQALGEANVMDQRRRESDQNNAFKARDQSEQERQNASSEARDWHRLKSFDRMEDRRQGQLDVENSRIKAADTRKLVEALQAAIDDGETGIAEALAAELKSRGWNVKPITSQPAGPPATTPGTPPGPPTPGAGAIDPATHSLATRLRGQLSENQATGPAVSNALGGRTSSPPPANTMSAADADLSVQLDGIESKYVGALQGGAPPKPLVPGRSLRPSVAQSNAMLSPDDPLNKIVQ